MMKYLITDMNDRRLENFKCVIDISYDLHLSTHFSFPHDFLDCILLIVIFAFNIFTNLSSLAYTTAKTKSGGGINSPVYTRFIIPERFFQIANFLSANVNILCCFCLPAEVILIVGERWWWRRQDLGVGVTRSTILGVVK